MYVKQDDFAHVDVEIFEMPYILIVAKKWISSSVTLR